ncbi:MAG: sigma-70 family RNA polymerase sigma factor [Candidatus Cloacimonetes bacterium]|nr:sigma-70 family RNA polymerase sigma factor [Candidatus Cloacimonadota bacterium]
MIETKFEIILQEESKKLYNYLLKILRNPEDAEDILQESFIILHKKMAAIEESSYKGYLYKSAYHKALNLIKKRNKKNNLFVKNKNMESYQSEPVEENQVNALISAALSKLKPEEALLIELQFYQKLSYQEIAKVLDTTESAVDSKLVRTKKKLKKIIDEQKKVQETEAKVVFINRGDKK